MSKGLRIGQFIGTMGPGGAESLVINLTQDLVDKGYDTQIICRKGSWVADKALRSNLPYVVFPEKLEYWWNYVYAIPVYTYHLRKLLSALDINVLHSHLYKATVENCLCGIPHIATQHDSYTITEKRSRTKWLRIAQSCGTELVSVSESIKRDYRIPSMTVIPNGFGYTSVSEEESSKVREELGIDSSTFVITIVARLIPLKKVDYLIESVRRIINTATSNTNIRLLVVGEGPEMENLKAKTSGAGLEEMVLFLGFRDDIPQILAASDLFVLPSRTEGLSCSIIEAMFAGLPIIATGVGGNGSLVENGKNGTIIPLSDDIYVLATAITDMMNLTEEDRKKLGAKSFEIASKNYSIEMTSNRYALLYNRLLAK